jgi:hypothetical protein
MEFKSEGKTMKCGSQNCNNELNETEMKSIPKIVWDILHITSGKKIPKQEHNEKYCNSCWSLIIGVIGVVSVASISVLSFVIYRILT